VLAFWRPADRTVFPHPFASESPVPASSGPDYGTVRRDGDRSAYTRLLAAAAGLRHAATAREGWGKVVRNELLAVYRDRPDAGLGVGVTALERALLTGWSYLRTSPRSPPPS